MKPKQELELREDFDKLAYQHFLAQHAWGDLSTVVNQELDKVDKPDKKESRAQEQLEQKLIEYQAFSKTAQEAGIAPHFNKEIKKRLEKLAQRHVFWHPHYYWLDEVCNPAVIGGAFGGAVSLPVAAGLGIGIGVGFLAPAAVSALATVYLFNRSDLKFSQEYESQRLAQRLEKLLSEEEDFKPGKKEIKLLDKLNFKKVMKKAVKSYQKAVGREELVKEKQALLDFYKELCQEENIPFQEFEWSLAIINQCFSYYADGRPTHNSINDLYDHKLKPDALERKLKRAYLLLKEGKKYQPLAKLEGIEEAYWKKLRQNYNPEEAYQQAYQEKVAELQAPLVEEMRQITQ